VTTWNSRRTGVRHRDVRVLGAAREARSREPHVIGYLTSTRGLDSASMPQDIRSSPDGRVFYVADMKANGVFLVTRGFRRLDSCDRERDARDLSEPRRAVHVRHEPRWNTTAGDVTDPGPSACSTADATRRGDWPVPRRQSRHGERDRRREGALVSGRYDEEVYVF